MDAGRLTLPLPPSQFFLPLVLLVRPLHVTNTRTARRATTTVFTPKALPFVFGVGVYCFEGMGMVIPIEEAMINPHHFTRIMSVVMVIYTTLCVLSGGLGYMAFGDATEVCRASSKEKVLIGALSLMDSGGRGRPSWDSMSCLSFS